MKNDLQSLSAIAGRFITYGVAASALILAGCGSSKGGGTNECDEIGAGCFCTFSEDCPGGFTFQEECNALGVCVVIDRDIGVDDTGNDAGNDTGDDTGSDTSTDVPTDAPDEVTPDVSDDADTSQDTGPDAPQDIGVDTRDIGVDTTDVTPDVEEELPPPVVNNPWVAFIASPFNGLPRLYITRLDGSGRQFIDTGDALQSDPAWSPDGTRLSFSTVQAGGQVIRILDMTTGIIQTIDPELDSFNGMTWSPDGETIAVEGQLSGADVRDIFLIDVATGEATQLTDTGFSSATPQWVRQDTLYLQSNFETAGPELDLYKRDMNTGALEPITQSMGILGSPQITWDGEYVVFTQRLSDSATRLIRYSVETGATEVVGGASTRNPAISRDGTWFAATEEVGDDGHRDIVVYDVNTLVRTLIVADPAETPAERLTESQLAIGPIESAELPYPPEG